MVPAGESPARQGSGTRPAPALRLIALLAGMAGQIDARAASAPVPLLPSGPLVQLIDTQVLDDHADISVQFACSARYVNNAPASHGSRVTITLRLGPDCGTQFGTMAPELPLVGGGDALVTGARVESIVPGEINLELEFARALDFVMAPSASGLGLKVRLLNVNPRRGKVFLAETEPPASYSVNLDASQAPIAREAVETAAAALQTQAYVSETDIGDQHWYRLRVGPFATRQEAGRVLDAAQAAYPHAWLAVDEETADLAPVERAGVATAAAAQRTDAPLPDDQRAQILHEARAELERQHYREAVDLLNRLLRQPEYPARANAQELMGLARERAGQLAQAKAEYQEYLHRYPDGAAAQRIRARLQALTAASLLPRSMGEYAPPADNRWTMAGSTALTYQYGRDQTVANGTTTTTNSLDAALIYGDLLVRDRGQRYDFTARLDAGYTQNIVTTSGGSQDRTTAAYGELTDKAAGVTARVGRQSLASQGVVGLFDGVYVGYQASSKWLISAAAGAPAYTSYSPLSGQQKFGTVTAEFDPFHQSWVFDAYLFDQADGALTDRRSIGFQTRYSRAGATAVVLVDYDLAFQQLNSLTLIGNTRLGDSWILGFDANHRRSPLLELSNALIGQSAQDLTALEAQLQLTPPQLRQLALDRTASSNTVVASASRALGERWQFMADLSASALSGTPASGGVAATGSTGLDKIASLQLSGTGLMQSGDLHIFSVSHDDSPAAQSTALSWDARFVLHGAWRLGPRLSVEQLNDPSLGGRQILYLPQVRGDWTSRRSVFELIAGYQLQNQQALQQQATLTGQPVSTSVDQRSLYVSVAYRLRF